MTIIAVIIAVILFCSAMSDWAAGKDWEQSEENAELRHEELMELEREHYRQLRRDSHRPVHEERSVRRKRYIRDRNRFLFLLLCLIFLSLLKTSF